MERGGEKAEDVPVPTDVDDEDMTLGDFFNKRKGARHDTTDAIAPRGTQKRARRERDPGEVSGAGTSAGAASSSDVPAPSRQVRQPL